MIKLYPAKEKYLPLEYYPNDYAYEEGYKEFIQQEGSHQLTWEAPSAVPSPVGSTLPSPSSTMSHGSDE